MANISVDTFLDGGTARTAGETWEVNGCTLTIRTDTRWHANAPASMTGSLGTLATSTSLGGSVKIDATKVRWMPYNSGSGTVPAIGTTITQGGVSGYLLGVWADIQSAPTAVGAAMPASGFLKFREVTGGTFSAGALTGISASATSPDVTGWIEVCLDASASFAMNVLGNGLVTDGGWFEIGTTNGSRGQTLNTPTNGGGANSFVYGVQIETAPGSGVYEWFPTASSTLGAATWTTANINTDLRSKFVESMTNGQIRIGSDGTNNIGYLPPSGCKVRIPNIIGRTVATASRATNQTPGAVSRAQISGGNYNIQYVGGDWAYTTINSAPNFILKHSTFEQRIVINDNFNPVVIDDVCVGGFSGGTSIEMTVTRCSNVTITNSKIVNSGSISGVCVFTTCFNINMSGVELIMNKARTGTVRSLSMTGCSIFSINGLKVKGAAILLTSCSNGAIYNIDYVDRLEGNTTASNGLDAISFTTSTNLEFNGCTLGEGGVLSNTQPYTSVISSGGNNLNVKVRNFGTRSNPMNAGSNATFYPNFFISAGVTDVNSRYQRMYITGVRGSLYGTITFNMQGGMFEDIYTVAQTGTNSTPFAIGTNFKKIGGSYSNLIAANNAVGVHWVDGFTSDTTGYIMWVGSAPSSSTQDKNYLVVTPSQGTGYVSTSGAVSLDTVGDYAFSESDWMFLGHTSFQNVAPTTYSNFSGVTIYYDINNGSGFSGTWKVASGANLSAETISPSGFKMRLKIVGNGSSKATAMNFIRFATNSTLSAQVNNQYVLDTNTLTFTGLPIGAEVRCFVGTDPATAVEIGGTESTGSSTFSFQHSSGGQAGYIGIISLGYETMYFDYTYKSTDDSILIQPIVDRNYFNPV